MIATIMDFRVREEMAGAVLKEVAALDWKVGPIRS